MGWEDDDAVWVSVAVDMADDDLEWMVGGGGEALSFGEEDLKGCWAGSSTNSRRHGGDGLMRWSSRCGGGEFVLV